MARCDVCGNDYDKAFTVTMAGRKQTFDSFECAIHALAPTCDHCGCRVIGHGVEAGGSIFCSAHCALDEVPEILQAIQPDGRLYATVCEFPTQRLLPEGADASAIIGVVGREGKFQIEVRLNRAPLSDPEMDPWLEWLIGFPVTYAPLPPFP